MIKIADLSNEHGSHFIIDPGDGKDRRVDLIHNGFDFCFDFIDLRGQFENKLYASVPLIWQAYEIQLSF